MEEPTQAWRQEMKVKMEMKSTVTMTGAGGAPFAPLR